MGRDERSKKHAPATREVRILGVLDNRSNPKKVKDGKLQCGMGRA